MSSLAVVVVNFNTRDHLRGCLRTVSGQADLIVVHDNGSTDGSVDMVRREFPAAVVSADRGNTGYGGGANRGIEFCGTRDVLILNSDTRVVADGLAMLGRYLERHPRAGIVGPRILNPDGSTQRSCFRFPSPLRPPLEQDPFDRLAGRLPWVRERCLATWSHAHPRVVPYVLGAALAVRRAAFDAVGGFDESFFMYAEEADLSFRMAAAGWQTHFAPVTDVVHYGGASTRQQRAAMLAQGCASTLQFYRRHYSGFRLAQAMFAMRCGMAARLARDGARYVLSAQAGQRNELLENVGVWRRFAFGGLTADQRH